MAFLGISHEREVAITWGDCDAAGVVFYPRYYGIFDASTHALLGSVGLDHHRLRREFQVLGTPLVKAEAEFRGAATYGDTLRAVSQVKALGRTSLTIEHRLYRGEACIVVGQEIRVWAKSTGERGMQAMPIPEAVRALLTDDGA